MPSVNEALLRSGRDRSEQLRIEEAFFRGLRLYNGTYKTTQAGRMPEVDQFCASLLSEGQSADVLDVGVSSGITSLDLLNALTATGADVRLTAADLVMHGRILGWGSRGVLLDSGNRTLQIYSGSKGHGRPHSPETSMKRRLLDTFMRFAGAVARVTAISRSSVAIVSRELAARRNVTLREQNIFAPVPQWRGQFWLVRAANILNLDYFARPQLLEGIRHLLGYVQPNGYLLINRTVDGSGENRGSIFQHRPGGQFVLIHEFGGGSEVAALVRECGGTHAV
jgi:hypothetical protein